ncbi:hypothetical protein [Mesohalobacter halotolerans]|uniref:Uncharacterized protein n=1 Tax=Mesohalobacter halotolerans TaxID=1883405 RepID=A0A4U5TR21_9FLAO|nr:hypothetical protein [Mesohalobacter halotolerans]TKS55838.1 hypothetical protein FCN74_07320 [Mesohalobacter halotolerans]
MEKKIALFFILLSGYTFAQGINDCQFNERFEEDHYFYSSPPSENLSTSELRKKLVSSIFSLIRTESKLELTNVDGESTSDFSQLSIVKAEAFLINPSQCQKDDGTVVIYISKSVFNSSFIAEYSSKVVLLKRRINSLLLSDLRRESSFLKEDIINIKKEFERLKFFLPFANSISDVTYDSEIDSIYESLTELEIFSLSIEDRILKIESDYLVMDCKEALQQVSSISSVELTKKQRRRLKNLRKNIEVSCRLAYKKDLKLAKEESSLFNNLEFAVYLQSYPINTSSELPDSNEFTLDSPFLAGRLNYFIGISNSGLRLGPYLRYFYLGGAILSDEDKSVDFSDSFSDAGLTLRYEFIKNFLQFEISVGRSLNEINPLAITGSEPFNFINISPGLILGTSKKLSFMFGIDYLAADDNSNYKYVTAKLGLNYNIEFKKINKNEKKNLKGKYEIKD